MQNAPTPDELHAYGTMFLWFLRGLAFVLAAALLFAPTGAPTP